jgi:hypothetical protein
MLAGKMSDKNLERAKVKFCKSASEKLVLLTLAHGENAMKKSSAFEWHRRFKKGREDAQDDPRSGQLKTQRTGANVNKVRTLGALRSKIWCYLEVMTRLQESVRRKRPKLWPDKRMEIMRYEFAFLAQKFTTNMNNPPYSPDSAPCDFWLFPK